MIWKRDSLTSRKRCELCGSAEKKFVVMRTDGLPIEQCTRCGFAYLSRVPSLKAMETFYDEGYFQKSDTYQDYFDYAEAVLDLGFCPRVERIKPFMADICGKKVLEIGCAAGSTLAILKRLGADVCGIEISSVAAEIAKNKFGIEVFSGPLEEAHLPPCEFDAVLVFDVLEHLLQPGAAMDRIALALKKGGLLFVSVPNFDLFFKVGRNWPGITSYYEHFNYFTQSVLEQWLKNKKFKILDVYTYTTASKDADSSRLVPGLKKALRKIAKRHKISNYSYRLLRRLNFKIRKQKYVIDINRNGTGMDIFVAACKIR